MFNNAEITSVTGVAKITTANSNLDGSGAKSIIFEGGANGAVLTSIVVKATETTTPGMVRIFLQSGEDYFLYDEFSVYATSPSGVLETYQSVLVIPGGLMVAPSMGVYATTQNSESFAVTASGFTWTYPS